MKVSTKVKAFSGLSNYIDFNQARILFNAVIMSNLNYCPLIWLFCSKAANSTINRVHKRVLRVLYQDFASSFEELLSRHDDVTIHVKNLQKQYLMNETNTPLNHAINKFIENCLKSSYRAKQSPSMTVF